MAILRQSTAYTRTFLMVLTSDHITGATGKSPTVQLSKAGGAFGAAAGTVTEIGLGWYKVALTTADTNTLGELAYDCSATGCDNTDFADQVGDVAIQANIKKNVALNAFGFLMYDTNGNPKTLLTVTAQRSLDGAAFGSCANAVTEISNGAYELNLAAADLNANVVILRFSATGARDTFNVVITLP